MTYEKDIESLLKQPSLYPDLPRKSGGMRRKDDSFNGWKSTAKSIAVTIFMAWTWLTSGILTTSSTTAFSRANGTRRTRHFLPQGEPVRL